MRHYVYHEDLVGQKIQQTICAASEAGCTVLNRPSSSKVLLLESTFKKDPKTGKIILESEFSVTVKRQHGVPKEKRFVFDNLDSAIVEYNSHE